MPETLEDPRKPEAVRRRLFAIGCAIGLCLWEPPPSLGQAGDPPSAAALMDELMWGQGPIGGPFELIDHTGTRRTDADFHGKLALLYFGYTFCPDICPADLLEIASALDLLGDAGEKVQPIFVTIDPERDTPERLASYVELFHPRLIGLTGEADAIRQLALAYKVHYAKVHLPVWSDYALDHSAFIYLIGPDGEYLGFFPPGTSAERMAAIIRPHLNRLLGRHDVAIQPNSESSSR